MFGFKPSSSNDLPAVLDFEATCVAGSACGAYGRALLGDAGDIECKAVLRRGTAIMAGTNDRLTGEPSAVCPKVSKCREVNDLLRDRSKIDTLSSVGQEWRLVHRVRIKVMNEYCSLGHQSRRVNSRPPRRSHRGGIVADSGIALRIEASRLWAYHPRMPDPHERKAMSIIRKLAAAVAILVLTSVSGPAVAQVKTDPEVAKALAMKAAALVKEQGVDAAKPIFHAQGEWRHDDIYVSVMDLTGTWLVYPVKPEGEGKSVINVKDADGKMLVQELVNTAKDKGEGWVEYRWLNPVSNKIEPKVTFVKMVPERNVFVYVGVYK